MSIGGSRTSSIALFGRVRAHANYANSTFLDYTSFGMTTATTVAEAYDLRTLPPMAGPTVNVALVLERANDPTALLSSSWGSRQQQLQALNDSGTLWSTYGASSADYTNTLTALNGLGITVIGDAAGSGGYVTSQDTPHHLGAAYRNAVRHVLRHALETGLFRAAAGDAVLLGQRPVGAGRLERPGRVVRHLADLGHLPCRVRHVGRGAGKLAEGPLSIGNNLYNTGQFGHELRRRHRRPILQLSARRHRRADRDDRSGRAGHRQCDPDGLQLYVHRRLQQLSRQAGHRPQATTMSWHTTVRATIGNGGDARSTSAS